jgi:hypothetical protein
MTGDPARLLDHELDRRFRPPWSEDARSRRMATKWECLSVRLESPTQATLKVAVVPCRVSVVIRPGTISASLTSLHYQDHAERRFTASWLGPL